MKLKKTTRNHFTNDNLFSEMFLQELENRLETDPLMPNGLVDLVGDSSVSPLCTCYQATYAECHCYQASFVS